MLQLDADLDSVALVTASKACTRLRSVRDARRLHEVVKRRGFLGDVLVGNAVVKMYIECGRLGEARAVFEGMDARDLVTWTTMVSGHVKSGGFNQGLKLLREMCAGGVWPDAFMVSAVLPACARMAARKNGKDVHGKIVRLCLDGNLAVENALMDMYVKSGCVEAASRVFERMVCRDVISWTVMIMGYSLHGQGEAGVELFKEMKGKCRVLPDRTTFTAALHAANTACLVEEGKTVFNCIAKQEVEHYALMAGLLSRGGYFFEARAFVEEHHLTHSPTVLRAVLNGCRIHQNVKLGKRIAEQLIELEPLNAENYVLLSNYYGANGKWELVNELRETIQDMGLKTKRAYSWIEIRNKVHVFGTGDVSHPRSEGIYWELERLMNIMKEKEGHIPREDYTLHDVDEERECIPCGHSEMLAIGLGLISGSNSGVLRVVKNLRVCRNCHDSAKLISRIDDQEIILKDPDRFHHFKRGTCSCRDMW